MRGLCQRSPALQCRISLPGVWQEKFYPVLAALEISRELEREFAQLIGESKIQQLRALLEHLVTRLEEIDEE